MTIKYAFTTCDGFVAVDPDSGLTAFAPHTSPFAICAKTDPAWTAAQMILGEQWRAGTHPEFAEYDARNVRRLALALYLDSTYKGGKGDIQ